MYTRILQLATYRPFITLTFYTVFTLVLWAQLPHLKLAPTESLMIDRNSQNFQNAKLINKVFGKNRNPFGIHRSTNLGHWLEIIVLPADPKQKLLEESRIREFQFIDQVLKTLTVSISSQNELYDEKETIVPFHTSNKTMMFKLSDICHKDLARKCSIDGSYVLDKTFIDDVIYEDLSYSKSEYYGRGSRSSPSYGPYMFGKNLELSEHEMIEDVNAIRFRYNLDCLENEVSGASKISRANEKARICSLWLNEASKVLQNIPLFNISIVFASSSLISDTAYIQIKQSVPIMIVSLMIYITCSSYLLTWNIEFRWKMYAINIVAVIISFLQPITVMSEFSLIHYRPTMTSLLASFNSILFSLFCYSSIMSTFVQAYSRQRLKDIYTTIAKCCSNLLKAILVGLCSIIIAERTAMMIDCVSSLIAAVLACVNTISVCLFVYMPLISLLYIRGSETLSANSTDNYPAFSSGSTLSTRDGHCGKVSEQRMRLLKSCRSSEITFQVSDSYPSTAQQPNYLARVVDNCLALRLFYTLLLILVSFILMLATAITISRSRMRRCEILDSSIHESANVSGILASQTGDNQNLQARKYFHRECVHNLQKIELIRQSDLMSPSLKTRKSLLRKWRRRTTGISCFSKQTKLSSQDNNLDALLLHQAFQSNETLKSPSCSFASYDLYNYFIHTETQFLTGPPIQLAFLNIQQQRNNERSLKEPIKYVLRANDVCPSLKEARKLLAFCRSLPVINKQFSVAWFDIYKENTKVTAADLKHPLFANDLVTIDDVQNFNRPDSSHNYPNKNRKTQVFDVQSHNAPQNIPCALIKHHRFYCAMQDMTITFEKMQSLKKLQKYAQELNHQLFLNNNLTNKGKMSSNLKSDYGIFVIFNLLGFIFELLWSALYAFFVHSISIPIIFIIISTFLLAVQLLYDRYFKSQSDEFVTITAFASEHCDYRLTESSIKPIGILFIFLFYLIAVVVHLLSVYIYLCLFGISITFLNLSVVIAGFVFWPLVANFHMIASLCSRCTHDPHPNDGNITANSIKTRPLSRHFQEQINYRNMQTPSRSLDFQNVVKRSSNINFKHFVSTIIKPTIIVFIPSIAFTIMIPFTDSSSLRSAQHSILFFAASSIFNAMFMYPCILKIFAKIKL